MDENDTRNMYPTREETRLVVYFGALLFLLLLLFGPCFFLAWLLS